MNREAFDHAIRAAAAVLGVDELLVIGSQAVYGSLGDDIPPEVLRSVEVDVAPFDDPEGVKSDLIDGSIGEASLFHSTFGFYAQGVSLATAVLPEGCRDRLVEYRSPMTHGVTAWCLELHDLWLSKAIAGRPKDLAFCRALGKAGLVEANVLRDRLEATGSIDEAVRKRAGLLIDSSAG